jgi:single-strand DNA-binding protein
MYQQVTLIGNLGNDPELRYTPSGDAVANFSLAVNRRVASHEGESSYKTTWFHVTAWRRQAEVANQYLSKGRRVMVVGEIDAVRAYLDREDKPRAVIDLTAREIQFLDHRAEREELTETAVAEEIPA